MHYFIIAGEASGDMHGAPLIEAIRQSDPDARFSFLGGDLMAAAAGAAPAVHYRDMAFMGYVDVIRHLGKIRRNFSVARSILKDGCPDALILIDYPSFNIKMAACAKKLGIPTYYYISPKVWVWKQWRVKTIKKLIDRMFVIFPFEVDFYRGLGYEVSYVGNPSVGEVDAALAASSPGEAVKDINLNGKPYVALLPGSRLSEIRSNLPVMVEAIKCFPQYKAVVAGAPGVDSAFYEQFTRINEYRRLPVVTGNTLQLVAGARAALVTSGTATLETALAGTPQVALYRHTGSKVIYNVMRRILKGKYVTLPNLVADDDVIPELLLHLCTPRSVSDSLGAILPDGPARQAQLDGYARIRSILGDNDAATACAVAITEDIREKKRENTKNI